MPRRAPVRHPRRVSGPTRTVGSAKPAPLAAPGPAIAALDRLIHGRLWIGLLAFSLIGIVAMQLVVLKLNTGIGHTLTREATLQRENAQLGIEDSMYSAESRVAPLAAAAGMTLAPPGTVHFVQAVPTDVARAAATLATPIQPSASSKAGTTETPGTTETAAATETTTATESTATHGVSESSEAASAPSPASETSSTASNGSTSAGTETTTSSATASPAPTSATGGSEASGASSTGGG
jgi:type IV secretory pathway TrbL component